MGTDLEVHTGGALAVSGEQTQWSSQQLAVLQSLGVSEEVSSAELDVFLHECQRTMLDPFSKQIYLIGREDKRLGRKVFKSQTGIDGYRVVAHRAARRDGVRLSYADTVWSGPDTVWREVWVWDKPPLAAKVTVYRDGDPFPAIATLNEYAEMWNGDLKGMWKRMPANQLAKCAEALALRKAFPNDLGGIYTSEEMGQADNEPPQRQAARSDAQPVDEVRMVSDGQLRAIHALLNKKHGTITDEQRHEGFSQFTKRKITTANQLTYDEASALIDMLSKLTEEEQATAARAQAEELAKTDESAPARVEADLRDGIESAGTLEELHTAWTRVEAAQSAGALDPAALGLLKQAATIREGKLTQGPGWSGSISRAMDAPAASS